MYVNEFIEESTFENNRQYMIKPLEHKGFNKHFINLVSADVFCPKKTTIFSTIKEIFFNNK